MMSPSSNLIRPAARVSLVDSPVHILRERIRNGVWKLGDKVPVEPVLAILLLVSRGTVHAAVRSVAVAGSLDGRQRTCTFAASATEWSAEANRARRMGLRSQFEVRRAIEVQAMRLAAVRAAVRALRPLRSLLEKRSRWLGVKSDQPPFVADDDQFHPALLKATHNPALVESDECLWIVENEIIASTLEVDVPEPDYRAHRSMLDAIESRSPARAEKVVRDFVNFILVALPEASRS
jgi:DNA-binding FadR family transcriptional regulator